MAELTRDTLIDGRYRIVSRIGAGGMAEVYCAEDEELGRQVALKLLHPRFAADEEFVERFRREASAAAGLSHPHVVGVYDRGDWHGTHYIAMEYLEGRSLKQLILDEAPIDPVRAIDLTLQVLRAARFAHQRGIIHRDLKPHNVIVEADDRAKVTDFGIARAGASDMTETGSILGTAQYLSPEQAQGLAVSAASDVYAIGIILFELLTGTLPFEGDAAVTIALKQVSERPPRPTDVTPAIPPGLEAVVMRALEKQPEHRFAGADEFIEALEGVRAELVAGGDGTGAVAWPPPVVEEEVVEEYPEEPRPRRWLWALLIVLLLAALVAAYVLTRAEQREVPNVVGIDLASASTALTNRGFEVDVQRVINEAPRDRVVAQSPEPRTEAAVGSTVRLTVSDGPGMTTVPDVAGLTRERARARLRDRGFRIREREETSDDVERGRAIGTSPEAGSQLERGRTVTLRLSTGREQVTVPDVVGDDRDEAEAELEGAGLRVSIAERASEEDAGTVLEQDPESGQRVDRGSLVRLVVARAPETLRLPDVTGESIEDATTEISALGLTVRPRSRDVDDEDDDGEVLSQNPGAGQRVRRGSTVTLIVGRFERDRRPPPTAPDDPETTIPPEP